MLYCFICTDKPDALELRRAHRQAHIDYWHKATPIRIGGPFTSEDGETMTGSLLIVEAPDRAAADELIAKDPFVKAGLFATIDGRPWKWTLKG